MTAIQSVGQVLPKLQIQNSNEKSKAYEKTNIGKWTGTGLGVATSAGGALYVGMKISENKEILNEILKRLEPLLPKNLMDDVLSFAQQKTVTFLKVLKFAGATAAAIPVLLGLGAGAIVDTCINFARKKTAEKAEQSLEVDTNLKTM